MFRDRADAGRRLADALAGRTTGAVTVLALPRGGIPVAREVARALDAPLEVLVIRKLGSPGNLEYAIGAIGEDGVRVVDEAAARRSGASKSVLEQIEDRERAELARRVARYRPGAASRLDGRTAVVVDDGVATGATARAAAAVARARGADRVVLATPVAPRDWAERLGDAADGYVAVELPGAFWAVGQAYADFHQVEDDEVLALLGERG